MLLAHRVASFSNRLTPRSPTLITKYHFIPTIDSDETSYTPLNMYALQQILGLGPQ